MLESHDIADMCSYAINYHPYFPIVPANVLLPQYLHETIKHESFLLTAALVVASRDRSDLAELHQSIWAHMRHLILDVVLGMSTIRSVGCVEGLLLLGEWTPLTLGQNDDGGEGAAWSIVGLGVRLAYLLRLEESSFRADKEADPAMLRRRLAWTCTLLSNLRGQRHSAYRLSCSHLPVGSTNLYSHGPGFLVPGPCIVSSVHRRGLPLPSASICFRG